MSDGNWYSESGWYEPADGWREIKSKKRGWTRFRIIGVVVLALALLIGSSLAFANGNSQAKLPTNQYTEDAPATEDNMPENWHDFFQTYYESTQSDVADVNIPKYTGTSGFSVSASAPEGEELSLSEIYERCSNSIVAISGFENGAMGYNWGTGIILSDDGYILTNTHVIEKCDSATVTLYDDTEYEAKLVGADAISDIALLKIEATGLPTVALGDSTTLVTGDKVVAIGNPLGESFRLTMTDGIVSAIDRGMNYNGHSMTLIQTNAALNEGNSGGALFNMYGQVIGVTNMKMMSSLSNIEGIGFAIPSATVCDIISSLMENGEVRGRPAIGITVGAIPPTVADYYKDIPASGLYVSAVSKGSDAESSGMKEGDIVTAVNGTPVTTTDDVNAMKDGLEVGDTMTFSVWRDGEELEIEVTLMDVNDIY